LLIETRFDGRRNPKIRAGSAESTAGEACLLLRRRETHYYSRLVSILGHTSGYGAHVEERLAFGLPMDREEARLRAARERDVGILAGSDIRERAASLTVRNVVVHKLANRLNQEDGAS
jgi:Mlc titration factor MtfA (ptsG expression regulator)